MDKVDCLNLKSIKETEQPKEKVQFCAKHDNKESDDKGMRKSTKWMIGATVLAATVAVSVLAGKRVKLKQSLPEIKAQILKQAEAFKLDKDYDYEKFFNSELLKEHIKEAEKLPLKEQVAKLNEIKKCSQFAEPNFIVDNTAEMGSFEFMYNPKLSKEVLETKDPYIIGREYRNAMRARRFKSCVNGETIEETLKNTFGEGHSVLPHKYDLTKESNYIITQQSVGGFKCFAAFQGGEYNICMRPGIEGVDTSILSKFLRTVNGSGNELKIARIRGGVGIHYRPSGHFRKIDDFCIVIPDSGIGLTQMQKDLLSIRDKITPEDLKTFDKLFRGIDPVRHEITNGRRHNYDAIASVIHTIANRA